MNIVKPITFIIQGKYIQKNCVIIVKNNYMAMEVERNSEKSCTYKKNISDSGNDQHNRLLF